MRELPGWVIFSPDNGLAVVIHPLGAKIPARRLRHIWPETKFRGGTAEWRRARYKIRPVLSVLSWASMRIDALMGWTPRSHTETAPTPSDLILEGDHWGVDPKFIDSLLENYYLKP